MGVFQKSGEALTGKSHFLGSTVFSSKAFRIALVTIAGLAGTASAQAAVYWSDEDPMVMSEPMRQAPVRPKKPKRAFPRMEKQVKETAKPVGPLVIAISIQHQNMKIYDANGLFAETPVSTGMQGHSTPMGVFSVIQKNKYHKSNIYSGAPMPFMQRITWSGIAMHAGVLPGYPASHGCIRMPMAFATKIWGWTRMGARVVITPGEISPSDISHPLLVAHKPVPVPVAAIAPKDVAPVVTTGKAAEATPAMSSASLELKPAMDAAKVTADSKRDQTQTADASGAMTLPAKSPVISDASPAKTDDAVRVTRRDVDEAAAKALDLPAIDTKPDEAKPVEVKPTEPLKVSEPVTTDADVKKDEAKAAEAARELAKELGKDTTKVAAPVIPPVADPAAAVTAAPKRSGQVAVLVSRKDAKLYVRQNFAPLFDVPITIAPSDRPLGTHIFTAVANKDDAKTFHWTAVSLPAVARRDEDSPASRRRKSTGAVEMKPAPLPDSATEALDRLTLPPEAAAQIADALANGTSIIVSDQGIAAGGETGQGTEFVVPLR